MNIPNTLTVLRIILVPVIVIFLMQGAFMKALILIVISGVTDGLDGFLARVLDQKTLLGAYLDPIADKALLMSCFVTLSVKQIIPGWLTVIVISRDCIILVGISVLAIMSAPLEIRPSLMSKITTVLQLVTVFAVLLFKAVALPFPRDGVVWTLFLATAVFTAASGLDYIFRGIRLMNRAV
ncbi:MAG TPA: CDP-alcohol phosphatidyltransferase family protein [Syntrophales bacterium]|nr:CDP-alcohol phosphatidyltransferase family protein [Syntrophales bacterium]HOM07736.1 CDP-alcohol phosphatidyltransferase family protein [Syntrophales bacterium]HOO00399.1 CDP-alcohol phosphatidyltransferase family protein [Syntrophales bacterium]HPC01746.1 CDP-alcohol phosphatidyltransferase family protein [Syntrophales bacterium]HPQ07259.1 CDP-alcohol phosphatidyltransferase family protein [Syntrophales bacterium]